MYIQLLKRCCSIITCVFEYHKVFFWSNYIIISYTCCSYYIFVAIRKKVYIMYRKNIKYTQNNSFWEHFSFVFWTLVPNHIGQIPTAEKSQRKRDNSFIVMKLLRNFQLTVFVARDRLQEARNVDVRKQFEGILLAREVSWVHNSSWIGTLAP